MTSDWAKRVAGEIKQRRLDTQRASEVLAEQRKLREEQGPALWREVCNAVQVYIAEVNAEVSTPVFVYNNLSTTKFSVTRKGVAIGDQLNAEFTVSSGVALFWKYEGRSTDTGSCFLAIDESGCVGFRCGDEGILPEALARKMLEGLI